MNRDDLVKKLTEAGVSAQAIEKLEEEELLDEKVLSAATDELLIKSGLKAGSAVKVKLVFPSASSSSQSAAPVLPHAITLVTPKVTDISVLAEFATGEASAVEAAREKFGSRRVFVRGADGKVDVEATKAVLAHITTTGHTPERFKNSAGTSVKLVTIGELLNTKVKLNPVTNEPMVPGDRMLDDCTDEQRLLIAYAVVKGQARGDEDDIIDKATASPLKGAWKNLATDLATAKEANDRDYQRALALLERSSSDAARTHADGSRSYEAHPTIATTTTTQPSTDLLARWNQQANAPLSPTEKADIMTTLTWSDASKLVDVFNYGGYRNNGWGARPRGTISEFLVPFKARGGSLPYTAENSSERAAAVNFFANNATEDQWRELHNALKTYKDSIHRD